MTIMCTLGVELCLYNTCFFFFFVLHGHTCFHFLLVLQKYKLFIVSLSLVGTPVMLNPPPAPQVLTFSQPQAHKMYTVNMGIIKADSCSILSGVFSWHLQSLSKWNAREKASTTRMPGQLGLCRDWLIQTSAVHTARLRSYFYTNNTEALVHLISEWIIRCVICSVLAVDLN